MSAESAAYRLEEARREYETVVAVAKSLMGSSFDPARTAEAYIDAFRYKPR